MQTLIELVRKTDPGATMLAKEVGSAAVPHLRELAKHTDPFVREMALLCLDEIGGTEAVQTFVDALSDEHPQVHAAALRALHHHPDPSVYSQLLQAYDNSADSYNRQQIALIIGRMGTKVNLQDLKTRYDAEKDAEAREGCLVALARLGDKHAQEGFIRQLYASQGRTRARFLEHCEYIHARWLLKPLLPLLSDKSPLVYIGIDARPELPQYLRTCDLVVNLVTSISGHKFSFDRAINYTDEQLEEVHRYLQQLSDE